MNDANYAVDRAMLVQIDRLVAGDLHDSERRNLLVWLDEDPDRWRACALAFLEAQSWELAATDLLDPASTPRTPGVCGGPSAARSTSASKTDSLSVLRALAIAVSLALAFAAGILLDHRLSRLPVGIAPPVAERSGVPAVKAQSPTEPLLATVAVRTNLDP